jgi:hypothetical protein
MDARTVTIVRVGLTALLVACALPCRADSPALPMPQVIASLGNRYYLKVVPQDSYAGGAFDAAVYKVTEVSGGQDTLLYRVNGWGEGGALLWSDGSKIARTGPWTLSTISPRYALAVAFYDEGRVVAQYAIADLMQDLGCIQKSTNHYMWGDGLKWARNDASAEVEIDTYDGLAIVFDIRTGALLERRRIAQGCRSRW